MDALDPLLTLKEEIEDAARREAGWLRLALALARAQAARTLVDEAYANHHLAGARKRQLLRHFNGSVHARS